MIIKKITLLLTLVLLTSGVVRAQFPPLEISADIVQIDTPGTVDVSIRAGTNWQNITALNGSISFDTTVITWDQVSFWGLSNPSGVQFNYQGNGILTYTWSSLITIGPTLNSGDIVFTLRFNVVGNAGESSPISFVNSPEALFWANGFGWSGNNFNQTNGLVTINTLGVIENDFGNELIISPNPTTGNFSIDFAKQYQSILISIYDIGGKLIRSKSFNQTKLINLSITEPTGLYLVNIQTGNKKAVIRLLKE